MLNYLRGFFRLIALILTLSYYVLRLIITGLFKGFTLELGLKHRQQCCQAMIKAIGIRLTTKGDFHKGNYLFISNHRCYLDPVAQLHDIVALPVAKAEVEKVPILGYGAKISGVHFVKRESLRSRKETRSNIAETIQNGKSILIYPEGTTVNTPRADEFKPGTFRMAAKNKVSIIPIAIEYGHLGDAWVTADSMALHFIKNFGKKNKRIDIHYGAPIWMEDGEELRNTVKNWIDTELLNIRKKWDLPIDINYSKA